MKLVLLFAVLSVASISAEAMTFGELKQVSAVLSAEGVPDSAIVKKGNDEIVLSPVNLKASPSIIETLDQEGHWQKTPGPMSSVTEIQFQ